jgi:hypothetical protein
MRQAARKVVQHHSMLLQLQDQYHLTTLPAVDVDEVCGLEKYLDDVRDMRKERTMKAIDIVLDLQHMRRCNRGRFLKHCEAINDIISDDNNSDYADAEKIAFFYRERSEAAAETAFDAGMLLQIELMVDI